MENKLIVAWAYAMGFAALARLFLSDHLLGVIGGFIVGFIYYWRKYP